MMADTDASIIQSAKALLQEVPVVSAPPLAPPSKRPHLVRGELADEKSLENLKKKQELNQQDLRFQAEMEQRKIDRELKKAIATLVFRFLAVETAALFIVVLLQGFSPFHFKLEDSTINIFLGATLLQISSMAVIITRHLYPTTDHQ
jgi:hypothetical protein